MTEMFSFPYNVGKIYTKFCTQIFARFYAVYISAGDVIVLFSIVCVYVENK